MKRFPILLALMILPIASLPSVHAMPSAVLQNDSSYVDSLGYYHVVGEVSNNGDTWLTNLKVTGTLKGAQGQIVDVAFTYTYTNMVAPLTRSPFDLVELDKAKSAATSSYSLALDFQQTGPVPVNLLIQGANGGKDNLGYFNTVGQVKNNGPLTSNFTKVAATYYNQQGKVIYVDFNFTSPDTIPPNQAYSFKILGPGDPVSGNVFSYNLIAESRSYDSGMVYNSIPEFPWPGILAIVSLTLGLLILRKRETLTTKTQA